MQTYKLYYDEYNEVIATFIDNKDLIERGIDTNGYYFRIVRFSLRIKMKFLKIYKKLTSIMIDGTQVNFEAAILGYNSQNQYQHYYFIDANIAGSDLEDSFANVTVTNPCDSNPCQNNGTCNIGLLMRYVCTCPFDFAGKN